MWLWDNLVWLVNLTVTVNSMKFELSFDWNAEESFPTIDGIAAVISQTLMPPDQIFPATFAGSARPDILVYFQNFQYSKVRLLGQMTVA